MADGAFVLADIAKLEKFRKESAEVKTEFTAVKTEFNSINSVLLAKWQGEGADEYKYEVDHILENIGGVADVLDAINSDEGAVGSIITNYNSLDAELAEFNKNPQSGEESGE
jgi:uncharacterized protein YukE